MCRSTAVLVAVLMVGAAPAAGFGADHSPPATSTGTVLLVDDDAPPGGDGGTWARAYRHLQDALAHARTGGIVQIRVARGVYRPDEGIDLTPGDRSLSFEPVRDVTIAGGYAGLGAQDPDERDVMAFTTALSGDLEENDGPDFANVGDNSYHVIFADRVTGAVLDGLTISGGHANVSGDRTGAAMLAEVSEITVLDCTITANLSETFGTIVLETCEGTFRRCRFERNRAGRGGGIDAFFGGTLVVDACSFVQNETGGGGGAIITAAATTITDCSFVENYSGGRAGAVFISDITAPLTIDRCDFERNVAAGQGGALYGSLFEPVTVTSCTFTGNDAGSGGVAFLSNGLGTFVDCTFTGNTARHDGAVMYNYNELTLYLIDCVFTDNFAFDGVIHNAGSRGDLFTSYQRCTFRGNGRRAIYENESVFEVIDCVFENNEWAAISVYQWPSSGRIVRSVFRGNPTGALRLNGTDISVVQCDFIGNYGVSRGAAVNISGLRDTEFVGRRFLGNVSDEYGGAVHVGTFATTRFVGCVFGGNAAEAGGAVYVDDAHPSFAGCTIYANRATDEGGGIVVRDDALVRIASTALWANERRGAADEAAQLFAKDPEAGFVVDYSCVQGWTGDLGGTGNLGDDPRFVDLDGADDVVGTEDDDVRLLADSPCIDAGHNWSLPADTVDLDYDGVTCESLPLDVAGATRFADAAAPDVGCGEPAIVDIGAHEHPGIEVNIVFADVNGNGAVDFDDLMRVLAAWGDAPADCAADIDLSHTVDLDDLVALLAVWGPCRP